MKKIALGLVVAAAMASGCAHSQKTLPVAKDEAYRIGREDVLDVAVWRDADMSRQVPVRPDGFISLPMVGDVKAEGKTTDELANELKTKLTPYIQDPKVSVILHEVNSSRIYVTGEVTHPGVYPLKGRVSVVQALAVAGGFTPFADQDGIVVIRQGKDAGKYPVRYSDLVKLDDDQKGTTEAFLQPGDTIIVP
ncbi:MAG: polysaccharide biosynthesis/export family protein [Myxococcaceae bacterium]